ncbi:MAG: FixH family protein [Caulobacterales bacterium]|nr:FixH family protein [Caulobacterales bacterium]
MTRRESFELKGWHVLAGMIAFFGVVIGVNIVFITAAAQSFPGLVVAEPFKRGLAKDFNATLAARAEQATRDWRASVGHRRDAETGRAEIVVQVLDGDGRAVRGLALAGALERVVSNDSRALAFRALGDGSYLAVSEDVGAGAWRVALTTAFPDGAPFEARRRVWMR